MDSRRHFIGKVATGLAGTLAAGPAEVLAATTRIRVGIIGAGDRGMELVPQIRACPNTEIAAFADIFSRRLERAQGAVPTATVTSDYRKLLEDKSIDAVVIATPPHLHAAQFVDALDAGKHVYQERVMAFSLDHAKKMRAAYQRYGSKRTVQIGHQACSFGHMGDVRQFLSDSERLGNITAITMQMHRNTPGNKAPWSRTALLGPDVNSRNIAWENFLGDTGRRSFDANRYIHWRYFWETSGGNVFEGMSQQLAFWYKALRLEISAGVSMKGGIYLWKDGREVPDTMSVTLQQPEEILISWVSGFGNSQLGAGEEVLGTHGTISRASQVRYVPQKINRPQAGEMTGRSAHVPHAHMENFFDCIRSGKEPNCPFEVGYRVSIACRMAVDSYRTGRTLRWDPEREEIV
ncbi:MAG: Gfo/Idh/MocA family oxidoreductase [Bryobacterales bacterium]|nr:Gfo/Idh/MocA family oxidoreductase [Bryobacterales bacterium]MBV9396985.1 Gfo/Idh/MocA family oxidoreductase [Bryobacterales bacterium]